MKNIHKRSIITYPLGNDKKEITNIKQKLGICNFNIAAWTRERECLIEVNDIITKEGGRVKVKPAVGDDVVEGRGTEEKIEKRYYIYMCVFYIYLLYTHTHTYIYIYIYICI